MTNDAMSLTYLRLDLNATSETIEQAIAARTLELRAAIARGDQNGRTATTEFTKQCAAARRWAAAQAQSAQQRSAVTTIQPARGLTLIECRACTTKVSPAAAACPRCGHPIKPPASSSALNTQRPAQTTRAPKGHGVIVGVLCLIGAALVLRACIQSPFSGSGTQSNSAYWSGAKSACQDAVRERLKSPASAVFGSIDEYGHNTTNEVREIRGSVDSQNGFGAIY